MVEKVDLVDSVFMNLFSDFGDVRGDSVSVHIDAQWYLDER